MSKSSQMSFFVGSGGLLLKHSGRVGEVRDSFLCITLSILFRPQYMVQAVGHNPG